MKRNLSVSIIIAVSLLLSAVLPATMPNHAQAQYPGYTPPPDQTNHLLLPLILRAPLTYSISGKVIDENNQPVEGVAIVDQSGKSALSNQYGEYTLSSLPAGSYELSPMASEQFFSPSVTSVDLTQDTYGIDFVALTSCSNIIQNSGFENNSGWGFPATAYTAGYSTANPHTGQRSARTGITSASQNTYSYSDGYQVVSISKNATSAYLRMWLFPSSTQVSTDEVISPPPEGVVWGTESYSYDAQYVLILDPNSGAILQTLLWWQGNGSSKWSYVEFNLQKYAGKSIRIQFGTYNNGSGGITSMYVDDVTLDVCTGTTPPPPPPSGCYIATENQGFEWVGSWNIPITAYSAGYSSLRAHQGHYSMRTGITNSYENTDSYSDAYQSITIPDQAASIKVVAWLYPMSTQTSLMTPAIFPEVGEAWGETSLGSDAQYLFMMNEKNGKIMEYLWSMSPPANYQAWTYFGTYLDPNVYRGKTVRLQFGSYNDGKDGITSMYVDDTYIEICMSGGEPPPPPPPPACTEQVGNGNFEANSAWEIPATAYSAGYSTAKYVSPYRSMRTGIVYQSHNRYSYSDARQKVTIPAWTKSAILKMQTFQSSSETNLLNIPEIPDTPEFGNAALSGDVQYILILDKWQNWIDTLLWQRKNHSAWTLQQFDLTRFAGMTIYIQFGTYNDGYGGVTNMYVDNASLVTCP